MDIDGLVDEVQRGLVAAADPAKAQPMAAYLKTSMPFHGVQKPGRVPILRRAVASFPPADRTDYREAVLTLWQLPHREEKYIALGYAGSFDEYIDAASIDLYRRLVVEGAWWDLVDTTATSLVGRALARERPELTPVVRTWIDDQDLWLRRTSIICQLGHKGDTDRALLAQACTANMADTEFFIRKAIGWALRDYARTAPDWVRTFVDDHRDDLSNLSIREATKHLD